MQNTKKEAEDYMEIRKRVTFMKICLEDMRESELQRADSQESLASRISAASSGQNEQNVRRAKAKLPKLELRKFSGNVAEWQEFWDGP